MKMKGLFLLMLIGLLTLNTQAFYNAKQGRWQSRDPIEETGGINVYGFLHNAPLGDIDVNGLWTYKFNGTWSPSEVVDVVGVFNTISLNLPRQLTSLRKWMAAASKLPEKCSFKKPFQQELTVLYQILSMMKDGMASSEPIIFYQNSLGKDNYAKMYPRSWNRYKGLEFTFSGRIDISNNSDPLLNFFNRSYDGKVNSIFHELTHVAGVFEEDAKLGEEGMWTKYAHNVDDLANNVSYLELFPVVYWVSDTLKYGTYCCPKRPEEWIPPK
jgi:hypothetical protein